MTRIVVNNNLTLDGVMQAPGRPDEDRRGGFEHGGWAQPYFDEVMAKAAGEGMAKGTALLLGRRTYEDFAKVWPTMPDDNPFTKVINDATKFVASQTLKAPLAWNNSTLLEGDAVDAVTRLKKKPGKDVVILGSGELIHSLMKHDLIDEYRLLIHPLILGSGRRLFADGGPLATFKLVDSQTTTTGVVIATYHPA
ncbi:MAG TPA: dihydrofolate reductase family protein [Candidatus Limnocylindrales bacterium]|nr:dihydrofolate reductase family protein [Candidatus Limnocylindrales bacterium]